MPGFYFDSKHIEAPKFSNSSAVGDAIKSVNPFSTLRGIWNDYLQGQHNIGVAEIENEALNADTAEAVDNVLNWARNKGFTESQIKDAKLLEKRDKLGEIAFRKAQEEQQRAQTSKLNIEINKLKYDNARIRTENLIKDSILPALEMNILKDGPQSTKGWTEWYVKTLPPEFQDMGRRMILAAVDKTQLADVAAPDYDMIDYFRGAGKDRNYDIIYKLDENKKPILDEKGKPIIEKLVPSLTFEQRVRKAGAEYDTQIALARSAGLPINEKGELILKGQDTVKQELNDRFSKAFEKEENSKGFIALNGVLEEAFSRFGKEYTPERIAAGIEAILPLNLWYGNSRDRFNWDKFETYLKGHKHELTNIKAAQEYLKYGNILKSAATSLPGDIVGLQTALAIQDANKSNRPDFVNKETNKRIYKTFEDKQKNTLIALAAIQRLIDRGVKFEELLPKPVTRQISPNTPDAALKLLQMLEKQGVDTSGDPFLTR